MGGRLVAEAAAGVGCSCVRQTSQHNMLATCIVNESVPKIIINDAVNFFLKLQSTVWQFQTITVSECCSIKLLPCILFEKYIYMLALEMASPTGTVRTVSAHFRSL